MALMFLFPETAYAMGTSGAQGGQQQGGGYQMLFMLVAIFAIFYFIIDRKSVV